jgi:hypothetical protein
MTTYMLLIIYFAGQSSVTLPNVDRETCQAAAIALMNAAPAKLTAYCNPMVTDPRQ